MDPGDRKELEAHLLDGYRLDSGAVVDLREVEFELRAFVADLALRLAQGQGYQELIARIGHASPLFRGTSPVAPGAKERPAVRVAEDLVYRVGVAEGKFEAREGGDRKTLPGALQVVRGGVVAELPPAGRLTTEKIVTVGEAMNLLGVTRQAVINAIRAGRLRGEQHGRLWILAREDVLQYRDVRNRRKAGRRR